MDIVRRNIKKISFKKPELTNLRKLGSLVSDPEKFQEHHGGILSILKTDVEVGALEALIRFYDPLYHCFTFPDYQLVPTLEEYVNFISLPVLDAVPFSGLEEVPKPLDIATALHLKKTEISANLTIKGGLQGLTSRFLYNKAFFFAKAASNDAFEAILALLIYGLVLFPNVDDFVDVNAIQIFLSKNPVPTLLADTYHSIHHRTQKGDGIIMCCAPLLYRWFMSHLPQTPRFKENPDKLRWPQRIMSLTPEDIVWYNAYCDVEVIIDGCGEFSNVPLLGTRGGINYNPILARRQFGYPMRDEPKNIYLTRVFYLNQEGFSDTRNRCVKAWRTIHRKDRNQLGKRLGIVSELYTKWVIDRATTLGIHYPLKRPLSSVVPTPSSQPLHFDTKEEFQEQLAELIREKDAWKKRCQIAELENETLKGELEQKDHLIFLQSQQIVEKNDLLQQKDVLLRQDSKRKKRQGDLFSSGFDSDLDGSSASRVRIEIYFYVFLCSKRWL
jgi:hypothetical protein